ncbi:blood vessel epicardial substance-like [Argonauta hians]
MGSSSLITIIDMMLFNTTDSSSSSSSSILDDPLLNTSVVPETNATFDGSESCYVWQDVQHILFQLGSLCMALSFLTPISFQYHILFLRCLLLFTFLFYILWAGVFVCVPDILAWNCAFFCINIGHIIYLAYTMYPVRIQKDFEDAYTKLFKPLGVSRIEFRSLTKVGRLVYLREGSVYATEGITPCGEKLSLLLRGRLKVTYDSLFLHYISSNQILDSAEYEYSQPHWQNCEKFQVTLVAIEDCSLLTWKCAAMQRFLHDHPFLGTVLHNLLGKDITHKLYQIQELLQTDPDYMHCPPSSRFSSMVDIRSSLATKTSCASLTKITINNSVELKGIPALCPDTSYSSISSDSTGLLNYETSV